MALGLPLFWAVRGARDEPERVRQNVRFAHEQGGDFLRIFADTTDWSAIRCADGSVRDRCTDPRWPEFLSLLRTTRDLCWDTGVRVAWTLFGGNQLSPDEQWHCLEDAIVMADERPETVMAFEISNEGNGFKDADGPARTRAMCEVIARHGYPVTLTSAAHAPAGLYAGSAATFANVHFDRQDGDNGWRWVRQPWGYPGEYEPVPFAFGTLEPGGPGASVHSDMDPLRIAMAAVHTWLCGGGIHVVHCGAGIYGVPATHPTAGTRAANLWEQPALSEAMALLRGHREQLPTDLPNWTRTRHGNNDHPFSFPFDATLDKFTTVGDLAIDRGQGCVRAYAAYRGGRFVCVPVGVMDHMDLVPQRATAGLTLTERAVILQGEYR